MSRAPDKGADRAEHGAARADAARLREMVAPGARPMKQGAGLALAAALIWPFQAWAVAQALGGLLGGVPAIGPGAAATIFFALAVLRAALVMAGEARLFAAAETVLAEARASVLAREMRAGGSSDFGGPGAVAALAGEKLAALSPYVTRYAPAQARVMVVPLVILALALWQSWAVAVIFLISGPLIPVFMALVGYAAKEASERQMAEIGGLSDMLADRLAALPDVRILNAQAQLTARFTQAAEDLRARTMAVLRVAFLSSTVLELFAAIGVAMVAVWVGFSLLGEINWGAWGGGLDPEAGIFLLLLAPEFYQPLRDLAAAWHDRAGALAVAGEMRRWEELAVQPIIGTGGDAAPLEGAAGIAVRGLAAHGVRYPDFTVTPGARMALTGPSGAGKTTLLRLLAGLERPELGEIEVAGGPLDEARADGWRARLAWMPQAPHFTARSLSWNIGFGAEPGQDALDAAALGEMIDGLPRGAATRLGETGAGLSGGEARRVMLARALQARADVLLADEPTADLDADTAGRVIDGLMEMAARGATLIVASHDPRLIARMDLEIAIGGAG